MGLYTRAGRGCHRGGQLLSVGLLGKASTRALLPVCACLRSHGQKHPGTQGQALHVLSECQSGKQLIVTLEVVRGQAKLYAAGD